MLTSDKTLKVVLVGDNAVGKSSLVLTYVNNKLLPEYIPWCCDPFSMALDIGGKIHRFEIYDTADDKYETRYLTQAYPDTDVLLFCFGVGSQPSLENIRERWLPEVSHHCPGVPIVLVATQIDLRDDAEWLARRKVQPITVREGQELAREVGAARYVECSAWKGKGVEDVFVEAVSAVVEEPAFARKRRRISGCIVV